MTTLKRRPVSARAAAQQQHQRRRLKRARARGGSALDTVMAFVPLGEEGLHRVFLGGIIVTALGLAWLVAVFAGMPALASAEVARLERATGFVVRYVDLRGNRHLNELKVYERVLAAQDRSMSEVDLKVLRAQLMELSWVADARVSRQLPDRIVVDVIERVPRAVVRTENGAEPQYVLVDGTGHPLEAVAPARAHDYPLIAGAGAVGQVAALAALIGNAPALRPQIAEADWVGNRRWTLVFHTGQRLALPEGPDAAAAALVTFARLDGINRLLGGRVATFDMRAGDRIYFRVPGLSADASAKPKEAE